MTSRAWGVAHCCRAAAFGTVMMAGGALAGEPLDATPRIAVVSAFPPEAVLLRERGRMERAVESNGVGFAFGTLGGKPVVLFESGVSMVNAAMTTQFAIDHLELQAIVFSGIAGGVDPSLAIGDVVVPAQWAQYLEAVFARAEGESFKPPGFLATPFANFQMIHPIPVTVRRAGEPAATRFWFPVDQALLAVAQGLPGRVELARCAAADRCLGRAPALIVGGNGVSGQAFVDNAAFRDYVGRTFAARALDMESAAVATVAFVNRIPFIAFRSLSDLAGGGPGENEMATFLQLAADNSAKTVIAFLEALPAVR